ncbi:MAG: aspartyl/asparaginyl beta-hydroxylase domain-containing protein [Planctomycetes bacterium]|nr:aspartyl/asparaginyl beta-hydroxylase domain-containing protein [Planctomycetota bacterium]
MLLDPNDYGFTNRLGDGFEVFRSELAGLARGDFLVWPDRGAYGGEWLVLPLFMSSHYPGIEGCFAANQAKCPATTAFLRAIPGVTAAAFSWQEPGCHIYPHRDVKAIDVLRAHVALEVPPGPRMRVGPDVHGWQAGEVLLFEGYVEHETGNPAGRRRVVLLVDAQVAPAEFGRLQVWRDEHGIAVDPALVLADPFARAVARPAGGP